MTDGNLPVVARRRISLKASHVSSPLGLGHLISRVKWEVDEGLKEWGLRTIGDPTISVDPGDPEWGYLCWEVVNVE